MPKKKDPENTYGLPTGRPLKRELRQWLERQQAHVLGTVPSIGTELPASFPPLADYDSPMAAAMTPILSAYWDESGKKVRERLGLDPDDWQVKSPHLQAKVQGAALAFCKSTNATTSMHLDAALARLRQELHAGLVEKGESVAELTERVKKVFDTAEEWRARQIAATEAARAVHAAQEQSAIESGVVAGFEWLISGDACPLCQMVAAEARRVKVGQAFAVVGDNPSYSTVRHPPLHPGCRCAMLEVLTPEYGGPEDPGWADTLVQPKPTSDYKPPQGTPEPKPEPEKLKEPLPVKPPAPAVAEPLSPDQVKAEALDRAVAIATDLGVEVEPNATDQIVKAIGKSRARYCPGAFSRGERKILLNPADAYWSDPAGSMKKAFASGWFSSPHPDHIVHHELGHALHLESVGLDRYAEIAKKRLTKAQLAKIGKNVSDYGRTQPAEFVAEVYAGMSAGIVYDDGVMALYKRFGGPTL